MMAPPPAPAVPGPLAVLDPTGQFAKRKRTSLWFTVALLVVSVFILTIGLAATTRTENVTVGGYYPGIVLGFGSFLGIVGIYLVENRRQILVASIVFISFGVVAAFCCAIVDGVFAARHILRLSWEGCEEDKPHNYRFFFVCASSVMEIIIIAHFLLLL